ncbi:MAG TPA: flavin reductase [Firmicutes bacterium]|jgi:flavin reductase (DIM6/NTAB) family NADH-FMN oxidoreductase RutF|nr:flavin reductase [Bacillota bacterium]
MMKEIAYNEYSKQAMEQLSKGAFLTTTHHGKTNTMTIGWGHIGFAWGKPIFTAMVRSSRYTYELIEKSNEFTVSIPLNPMKQALGICGSKSGRETDKIAAAELTLLPGQKIATPVISGCGLHFECKIVYKQAMDPAQLDKSLNEKCYDTGDYHTFYAGEILACYTEE